MVYLCPWHADGLLVEANDHLSYHGMETYLIDLATHICTEHVVPSLDRTFINLLNPKLLQMCWTTKWRTKTGRQQLRWDHGDQIWSPRAAPEAIRTPPKPSRTSEVVVGATTDQDGKTTVTLRPWRSARFERLRWHVVRLVCRRIRFSWNLNTDLAQPCGAAAIAGWWRQIGFGDVFSSLFPWEDRRGIEP
jgi:hypothetical protein